MRDQRETPASWLTIVDGRGILTSIIMIIRYDHLPSIVKGDQGGSK
jgi:hypothetical protein